MAKEGDGLMPRERYGERLPVDTRIIQRIMRSPQMMAEQSKGFMSEWGGPALYTRLARRPAAERMVYYAISEGHTTSDAVSVATGLDVRTVEGAVSSLEGQGLVTKGAVTTKKGV